MIKLEKKSTARAYFLYQVYDQSFEAILNDLGLDARGVAASEGWEVDGVLLRSSIRRLRGICTHPQVGFCRCPDSAVFSTRFRLDNLSGRTSAFISPVP